MNKSQIFKSSFLALIMVFIMLLFEILFYFPSVSQWIASWIDMKDGKGYVLAVVWVIMFLQVCIVPIPAYIPINAALHAKIIDPSIGFWEMFSKGDTWLFMGVVLSAYMAGALAAYYLGYFWGAKAVKWVSGSEEDYNK